MPGHWYLICPSIVATRGELHHPTVGWEICEVPRANSRVMWCKLHRHAHTAFKCIKLSCFFVWTKYSARPHSFTICKTTYAQNQEHAFITSNNIRCRCLSQDTCARARPRAHTHTHTHTHTWFIFQRTWILKYHKPDGNSLGSRRYLYLSTLGHYFHENGTVILSRGQMASQSPANAQVWFQKQEEIGIYFVKSSVALEIREKFLVYKLS